MGCSVAGGLEFGAGLVRGHQHASGVRLVSAPPIQACCQHAWCLAYVELCPLGMEFIGGQIVPTHAMPKKGKKDSCHGEAASLVIGCTVDPTIPYGLLYLSVRIAETLAIGND